MFLFYRQIKVEATISILIAAEIDNFFLPFFDKLFFLLLYSSKIVLLAIFL
ncbi:hypothetical protein SD77_1217 [Bacillus badius]|uniref:Uncharacterized protein n=1 Tax=Bacillus badius TaxID=1455 RepID=A0ABR5ASB9_BACBA|nr:hypothetical protein SD78_3188 [Bacillus badius]KIL77544.1 hypothetical protein SD77_1217 [Bacillus badius]